METQFGVNFLRMAEKFESKTINVYAANKPVFRAEVARAEK